MTCLEQQAGDSASFVRKLLGCRAARQSLGQAILLECGGPASVSVMALGQLMWLDFPLGKFKSIDGCPALHVPPTCFQISDTGMRQAHARASS